MTVSELIAELQGFEAEGAGEHLVVMWDSDYTMFTPVDIISPLGDDSVLLDS